jgi:hypothetical protein
VNVGVLGMFEIMRTVAEPDGNSMWVTVGPRRPIPHRPAPIPPNGTNWEEWTTSDVYSPWISEVTVVMTANAITIKKVRFLYKERDLRCHRALVAARLTALADYALPDQPVQHDYEPILIITPSPPPLVGARTTTAPPAISRSTPTVRREFLSTTS